MINCVRFIKKAGLNCVADYHRAASLWWLNRRKKYTLDFETDRWYRCSKHHRSHNRAYVKTQGKIVALQYN